MTEQKNKFRLGNTTAANFLVKFGTYSFKKGMADFDCDENESYSIRLELTGAPYETIQIGDSYIVCGADTYNKYSKTKGVLNPTLLIYNEKVTKPTKKLPKSVIGSCTFDAGDSEYPATYASLTYIIYLSDESFKKLEHDLTNNNLPSRLSLYSPNEYLDFDTNSPLENKKVIRVDDNSRWVSFPIVRIAYETTYVENTNIYRPFLNLLAGRLKIQNILICTLILILLFTLR